VAAQPVSAQAHRRQERLAASGAGVRALPGVLTHVADERALVPEVDVAQTAGKLFPVHVHLQLSSSVSPVGCGDGRFSENRPY